MKSAVQKSEEAYAALDESSKMIVEIVGAAETYEQVEPLTAALKSDVNVFLEKSVRQFPPSVARAIIVLETRYGELEEDIV